MKKTANAIGGRNLRKGFTRRARDLVQYTQLRCFGRRPHALYGQTVNLFLASVISPHNSCKLRCQQLRFQRRQPAVSNIIPSCR